MKKVAYLVRNNEENYKVQKMYFKKGIEWGGYRKKF